jgi:hypothetical protein
VGRRAAPPYARPVRRTRFINLAAGYGKDRKIAFDLHRNRLAFPTHIRQDPPVYVEPDLTLKTKIKDSFILVHYQR